MNKKTTLKILATVLLFLLVLFKLNFSEVFNILANTNFFLISFSLFFVPVLYSIRVLKWDALLRSIGIRYNFFTLLRIILIGMFYGMVTPGHSGEVARAYYISNEKSRTIPTIIWDKVIDIFVLIVLSFLSMIFLFYDANLYIAALFLILIFIIATAIFLNKKIINFLLVLMSIDGKSAKIFIDTIHSIKSDFGLLIKLFILSICYYLTALIMAVISLKALSNEVTPYAALTLPIIVLVGNIPITISGLGLREYVTILCFGILGEKAAIGFSFSILLFFLITLIPGLTGGIFILKDSQKMKNMEQKDQRDGQVSGLLSPLLERWRLKKVVKWVSGNTVLDCGCGSGKILDYLPAISKYTGIDSDEKVIENAKMRKLPFDTDYFALQLGKEKLELKDKYDTIIMSAFIEHLDNPLSVLEELKMFLAENGRIIITTPSSKSEWILNIGSKFNIFSGDAFREHKNHFSKQSLIYLMNKSGLDIVHYEKFELGFNQLIVAKRRY